MRFVSYQYLDLPHKTPPFVWTINHLTMQTTIVHISDYLSYI